MKLLRVWSFEFGRRSNYFDIIWLHRFLYCAVRTSCCFSRNWSGRRNHPVWQGYVIDDQQTWTSGQKAMSHIANTSQQFTYNFQWIYFFSKPRRLSGNFLKLYTTMALRARSILKIEFFSALSCLSELSQKINRTQTLVSSISVSV